MRFFSLEWDQIWLEWAWPMKPARKRKALVFLWACKYAAKARGMKR